MNTLRPLLFPVTAVWFIAVLWWVARIDPNAHRVHSNNYSSTVSEASVMRFGPTPSDGAAGSVGTTHVSASRLPDVMVIPFVKNEEEAGFNGEVLTQINAFAIALRRNPEASIVVSGHTDSDGAASLNKTLSLERAEAVKELLTEQGVPADRIRTVGMGAGRPIADNFTSKGKAKNRRVEVALERTSHEVH